MYKYITDSYYSNCLIEAIKAKLKNPKVKIYCCPPNHREFPHFMWSDGEHDYDFSDYDDRVQQWWHCLLFKGKIRQYRLNFAKEYSEKRRARAKEYKYRAKVLAYRRCLINKLEEMGATASEIGLISKELILNAIKNKRPVADVAWAIMQ